MQSFMVVMFDKPKPIFDALVEWLSEKRDLGEYHAEDMSQFSFNACPSKLILIDFANMALGHELKARGFNVRHQQWRDL